MSAFEEPDFDSLVGFDAVMSNLSPNLSSPSLSQPLSQLPAQVVGAQAPDRSQAVSGVPPKKAATKRKRPLIAASNDEDNDDVAVMEVRKRQVKPRKATPQKAPARPGKTSSTKSKLGNVVSADEPSPKRRRVRSANNSKPLGAVLPSSQIQVTPVTRLLPIEKFDINKERDLSNFGDKVFTAGSLPIIEITAVTTIDDTSISHIFDRGGFCFICKFPCRTPSTDLDPPYFLNFSLGRLNQTQYPDIQSKNQLFDEQSLQLNIDDTSFTGSSEMAPHPDDGHRLFANELSPIPQYSSYEDANIANGLPPINGSSYGYQGSGQMNRTQFQQSSPMGNAYQAPAARMSDQYQQTAPSNSESEQSGQVSSMYQQPAQISTFDQRSDSVRKPYIPVAQQSNPDYQPTSRDYTYVPEVPANQNDWNFVDEYGFPCSRLAPGVGPLTFDASALPVTQQQASVSNNGGQDSGRGRNHTRTPTQARVAQAWQPNAESSPYKAQYHHRNRENLASNSKVVSELGAGEKRARDGSRGRYMATEEGAGSYQVMRSNDDGTQQVIRQVDLGIQREGVPGPNGQVFDMADHWMPIDEWDAVQNNDGGLSETLRADGDILDHLKPLTSAEIDGILSGANNAVAEFDRNDKRILSQCGSDAVDDLTPLSHNQTGDVSVLGGQQLQQPVTTPVLANDTILAASYNPVTDITTTVDTSNDDEVVNVDTGDTTMKEPLQSEFTNMMDDHDNQGYTDMLQAAGLADIDMSKYTAEELARVRNGLPARSMTDEQLAILLTHEMNRMRQMT